MDIPTVSYETFIQIPNPTQANVYVNLDSCPARMRQDYARRNKNVEQGQPLCQGCDGTGNAHQFSYKPCATCGGLGVDAEVAALKAEIKDYYASERRIAIVRADDIPGT